MGANHFGSSQLSHNDKNLAKQILKNKQNPPQLNIYLIYQFNIFIISVNSLKNSSPFLPTTFFIYKLLLELFSCQQSIYASLAQQLCIYINKQYAKMPPKSTPQKTVDYFTTVEAGDIALFDIFEEAVAMFGFTKVGKTTSCHHLTNSTLRSKEKNGDLVYEPAGLKYPTAKIGQTHDSETEIPNIFEFSWKDDKTQATIKVALLDQPGYGDSYGFHRILSNGYFHYRSFSKTPKLKFILAFNKTEMKGTATVFTKTIFNFINSFTNYNQIKNQILAATTFLVTQVEHNSNLANIVNIIKQLKDNVNDQTDHQRDLYQGIIDHMIKNEKIFIMQKPAAKGTQTVNSNMLQQIYAKTKFWVRNVIGNVVDMSDIKFSVAKEILISLRSNGVNKLFNQDYAHFMNFMNQRINNILINHPSSLKNLIQILINDAVGEVNTHSFLETMKKFNVDYYKFDERYGEKRRIREANLFKSNELVEINNEVKGTINNHAKKQEQLQRQKEIRSAYFVKKFKVLQFVIQKAVQISDDIQKQRTIKQLEAVSIYFIEMFKKMSILRWQRDDPEKIIYKYTYIIQRMIEEAKIITLILFNKEQDCAEFEIYNSTNKIKYADIYRKIQDDVLICMAEIKIAQLKEEFCENIDITTLDSINQQIVTFFESCPSISKVIKKIIKQQIDIFFEPDPSNPKVMKKIINTKVTQKIINLLIRYSEMLNHKKRVVAEEEKKYVAYKIFFFRNLSLKYLKNLSEDDSSYKVQRKQAIEQIFRLSTPLASILTIYTHYDAARAIYQSIHNADMTFKIFEMELKTHETNPSSSRRLLIDYGKYAATTHRKELAMKCYQQAYSKSFEYDDLTEVGRMMQKLNRADQYDIEDVYIKNIFNQNFCLELSPSINEKIEVVFSPNEEPSL